MTRIHLICTTWPNFMKVAPLYHALKGESWCNAFIVHTGQRYDYSMSQAFFDDLELPSPHHYLDCGGSSHAEQTAHMMMAYEKFCQNNRPDIVIVVGDVNSTMACAISAKKLNLLVVHLEAGVRSFDHTMPEEINRIITDSISDYHWTHSPDADENLTREGIEQHQIKRVGNIMIDVYCRIKHKIEQQKIWEKLNLKQKDYIILTLHRPANVDSLSRLSRIIATLSEINIPIIFPVHPRTRKNLQEIGSIAIKFKLPSLYPI